MSPASGFLAKKGLKSRAFVDPRSGRVKSRGAALRATRRTLRDARISCGTLGSFALDNHCASNESALFESPRLP
jgi:hypothetical protein